MRDVWLRPVATFRHEEAVASSFFVVCTKFDQLILRKIIKIVASRCQILTLKCTKIDFGWGSAPDPAGGAYSAPPDPLAGFNEPTSNGRGGGVRPVCLLVLTILATGLWLDYREPRGPQFIPLRCVLYTVDRTRQMYVVDAILEVSFILCL